YDPETGRYLEPNDDTGTESPYQSSGFAPEPGGFRPEQQLGTTPFSTRAGKFLVDVNPFINYIKRYRALKGEGGLSGLASGVTSASLAVGGLLGTDKAIEATTNYNTLEHGVEFTAGGKAWAYGELAVALAIPVVGGKVARFVK